jgi:hypothetical protein
MSRIATTPQSKTPVATPVKTPTAAGATSIPQEKIAQRAYEKWLKRGCSHGSDQQDWIDAEAELRAEASSKQGAASTMRR